MNTSPIVSWTTPWQRANAAWLEAAEHMEFHRWEKAAQALHEHARQLRLTIEQLKIERGRDHVIAARVAAEIKSREDHTRNRLEQLRPAYLHLPGSPDWGG